MVKQRHLPWLTRTDDVHLQIHLKVIFDKTKTVKIQLRSSKIGFHLRFVNVWKYIFLLKQSAKLTVHSHVRKFESIPISKYSMNDFNLLYKQVKRKSQCIRTQRTWQKISVAGFFSQLEGYCPTVQVWFWCNFCQKLKYEKQEREGETDSQTETITIGLLKIGDLFLTVECLYWDEKIIRISYILN